MTEDLGSATGRGYAIGHLTDVDTGAEIIEYMDRVEATFEPYGGQWLVHGSAPQVLEGDLPGDVVIIGFPSIAAAGDWYASPPYQEICALRADHSRSVIALLAGVADGYRAADTIAALRPSI